jgi:hypothetical protein
MTAADRRSKELFLTSAGQARLREAQVCWSKAEAGFETAFGNAKGAKLRTAMRAVTLTKLGPVETKSSRR